MATINVKDAAGTTVEVGKYLPGRQPASDSMPVVLATKPTPVNRSGTIIAGGTAQQLMPANAQRQGWWIQNLSSGDLWISDIGTAAASQPSLKISAGQMYEHPDFGISQGAVSIFGTTTGQTFSAREF